MFALIVTNTRLKTTSGDVTEALKEAVQLVVCGTRWPERTA